MSIPALLPPLARRLLAATFCLATALPLPALAQSNPLASPTLVWVLTHNHELVQVQADQPATPLRRVAISGLPANHNLVGLDYRVARGVLYTLSQQGQLYTVNTSTGQLTPVGRTPGGLALHGQAFGLDFNPAADRIRVVSNTGQNLRLHPDTGALAATDPTLHRAAQPGATPAPVGVIAAAYSYNTQDSSQTTNYALVPETGTLVLQGSREGSTPMVSPNTGQLFPVGPLGTGPLGAAAFDIADVTNRALAALQTPESRVTELFDIHLEGGRATRLGALPVVGTVRGIAIEP